MFGVCIVYYRLETSVRLTEILHLSGEYSFALYITLCTVIYIHLLRFHLLGSSQTGQNINTEAGILRCVSKVGGPQISSPTRKNANLRA
jgi:hypothetical protein